MAGHAGESVADNRVTTLPSKNDVRRSLIYSFAGIVGQKICLQTVGKIEDDFTPGVFKIYRVFKDIFGALV